VYEEQTFDVIMARLLSRVPNDVDKREGSIIHDALAPAAIELAQAYRELDINRNLSYADTATDEYLERRTAEFGVTREPATKARRKGEFFDSQGTPLDIPIGSRFSLSDLNYVAVKRLALGQYEMECETLGVVGNQHFGVLLPIEYINGLARAELTDVIVPGEDEESDESLRIRYFETINSQPFGGNIDEYKAEIRKIPGVGGVKVFPVWQGGGTVKCTIIASDFGPPTSELVDEVQTFIDPVQNSGQGLGLAPIGHRVTIRGVTAVNVDIATNLTLSGVTTGQVEAEIAQVIGDYLMTLRKAWSSMQPGEGIIVRISQVEARILGVNGVVDVSGTKLNDIEANLQLAPEEVPRAGVITLGT
jgi:Uncharacterized homolog of phage Mu protein gp47